MKTSIKKGRATGEAAAPPSKSYAHRLLIAAAFAKGESKIENVAFSEDISATLDCLRALGASVRVDGNTVTLSGGDLRARKTLPCRESGSTLRFLIPAAILFGNAVFGGSERLIARGIDVYRETLTDAGFLVTEKYILANGTLKPGDYTMRGDVSSQFISGMLFALPQLEGDSTLTVLPPFESREYVDITLDVLSKFGIEIEQEGLTYRIRGGQTYKPQNMTVEGDHSNAAFLLALGVKVTGLCENSKQGDRVAAQLIQKLEENVTLDLSDCPDLAPVLFAVAAANKGARFTGTRRLAIKESNRAEAMAAELAKLGVAVTVGENEVTVGSGIHAPTEVISGHNDHRIVMAMSVLLTLVGGEIEGSEAIKKSYPDFFEVLSRLGIEVTHEA